MTVRRGLLALALLLLFASSAQAATRQIIRGAGFGHGIGMSQYGAYGYARHRVGYAQVRAHYYPRGSVVASPPAHHLDDKATYPVRLSGLSGEDLPDSKCKRIDHYDGPLPIS